MCIGIHIHICTYIHAHCIIVSYCTMRFVLCVYTCIRSVMLHYIHFHNIRGIGTILDFIFGVYVTCALVPMMYKSLCILILAGRMRPLLACLMCKCWPLLCAGVSLCYVPTSGCVVCSLQPRVSSLRSEHASLRSVGFKLERGPLGLPWYTSMCTSLHTIVRIDVYIACKICP